MNPAIIGKVGLDDFENQGIAEVVGDFIIQEAEGNSNFTKAEIRGEKLHMSSTDLSEMQPIISVKVLDVNEKSLGTAHVRVDGTGTVMYRNGDKVTWDKYGTATVDKNTKPEKQKQKQKGKEEDSKADGKKGGTKDTQKGKKKKM